MSQPRTRELGTKALAILVLPRIYKAGLLVGGQTGDGALFAVDHVMAGEKVAQPVAETGCAVLWPT